MHPCKGGYRFIIRDCRISVLSKGKNNDNPFFREAIVIFCTQGIKLTIPVPKFYFFVQTNGISQFL